MRAPATEEQPPLSERSKELHPQSASTRLAEPFRLRPGPILVAVVLAFLAVAIGLAGWTIAARTPPDVLAAIVIGPLAVGWLGAAVHFALAASFFAEVRVVGPVGGDEHPGWRVA